MKLLRTIFFLAVLALIPALAACSGGNNATAATSNGAPLPAPGRVAPGISLTSLQGQAVTLAGFRGQPVLVNFFATWCGPCRSEMGYLQSVDGNAAFKQAGFTLLEVNIQEDAGTVRKFLQDNGLDFSGLLLDTNAVAARAYNVDGIPASFFIDRNGILQKVKVGAYANLSALERDVQALIDSQ
jgi:thiol-disulfide isomerase/thioredoxin